MSVDKNLAAIVADCIETIDEVTHIGFARTHPEMLGPVVAAMIHSGALDSLQKDLLEGLTRLANAGME